MRAKLWIAAVLVAATAAAAADAGLAAPSKTRRPFSEASRATLGSLQELDGAPLLVQLARGRQAAAAPLALRRAGARLVSETLRIWVVPASNAQRVVAPLIRGGAVVAVERNRTRRRAATPGFTDPLWPSEWWRAAVGADAAPLLPAGVPLTIVDSGVDLTHPEFQGAHITLLNQQFLGDASDDDHGTAVTSVAAAPANGFGMVGIYPNANVWEWDGRSYRDSELIAGIDTAVRRGRSVINMSWDGTRDDPLLDYELLLAFGTGSVLVAAAGNEFDEGNPIEFPASLNHVLTVASTDQASRPSYFSNSNDAVDLAAPGEGITVAVPYSYNPNGFDLYDGTSFSAPMVAAATAGVWSARTELDNTQMFDLMRYSAHDLGRAGFDPDTGYGLLDIQAALSQAAPGPSTWSRRASCSRTRLCRSLALDTAGPPFPHDWTTRRTLRTCTASGCRLSARSPFGSWATPTSTSSCGRPGPRVSTSGERPRSAT